MLNEIKSKIILKFIFNHLKPKLKLKLLHHNKEMQ